MSSRNTANSQRLTVLRNQQSLRQRRGITLSVHTSLTSKPRKSPATIAKELARRAYSLRKNMTSSQWTPTPPRLPLQSDILNDLSVAYWDFDRSASPSPGVLAHPLSREEAERLREYTHVVRIIHAMSDAAIGERKVHFDEEYGIHTLSLFIPPALRTWRPRRTITALTAIQLEAIKDFLDLALPYDRSKFPREPEVDTAKVLITAPRWDSGEVDVMSGVLCYLSFVSRKNAHNIWTDIGRMENAITQWEWKRALDGRGVLYIQQVVDWLWQRARQG